MYFHYANNTYRDSCSPSTRMVDFRIAADGAQQQNKEQNKNNSNYSCAQC